MFGSRWFAAIAWMVRTACWAIGYLFGFSLTAMVTLGLVAAEEFTSLFVPRPSSYRLFFQRDDKYYLRAEAVVAAGWAFLLVITWIVALLARPTV